MTQLAPGARALIRDEEWLIRRVDPSADGGWLLTCDGISDLVRGHSALFLTALEDEIAVLDPAETLLVQDDSPTYNDTLLYSVDTLKSNLEYRNYLENAWWDMIVIDECHNVAARAGEQGLAKRAKLARLLATRFDTLILLSATPHDGSARSFATLMALLDPTAISDPDDYTPVDFKNKGLVIRRFKKDIKDQVTADFQERVWDLAMPGRILKTTTQCSPELPHQIFTKLQFIEPGLDRFAQAVFLTGYSSAGGDYYEMNELSHGVAYGKFSSIDALKEIARKRIDDPALVFPFRAAWMAVLSGEKVFAN